MTAAMTSLTPTKVEVAGVHLEVLRGGSGPRVLVLHDEWGLGDHTTWSVLADSFELIVPIHPGFEDAEASPAIKSVGDLAQLYLKLLDAEGEAVTVLGASLGGWIALEMAVRCPHHLDHLALVSPVGLRFGGPEVRNFLDLFAHTEEELAALLYADPAYVRQVDASSTDEQLTAWVHNREATARYGWEPYLHTPGLGTWTRHLGLPVLLVHGDADRFVREGYYDDVARALPPAVHRVVVRCGHFPLIEQTAAVVTALSRFVGDGSAAAATSEEALG